MSKEYYLDKTRVSNSGIGDFLESPKTYKLKLDGTITLDSQYLKFGRALHCFILEPKTFWTEYRIKDYEVPRVQQQKDFCLKFITYKSGTIRQKVLKAYKFAYSTKGKSDKAIYEAACETFIKFKPYIQNNIEDSKREYITWSQYRQIVDLASLTFKHDFAAELLNKEGRCEFHIDWEYEGVDCKSLIDKLVIDHENKKITIIDLKTTASIKNFTDSIMKYGYRRQMMFYCLAAQYYSKHIDLINAEGYELEAYLIAMQTSEIPRTEVFYLSSDEMKKELKIIKKSLNKIKWHKENDIWEHDKEYYDGKKYIEVTID